MYKYYVGDRVQCFGVETLGMPTGGVYEGTVTYVGNYMIEVKFDDLFSEYVYKEKAKLI
jgi:hypothetical protein